LNGEGPGETEGDGENPVDDDGSRCSVAEGKLGIEEGAPDRLRGGVATGRVDGSAILVDPPGKPIRGIGTCTEGDDVAIGVAPAVLGAAALPLF